MTTTFESDPYEKDANAMNALILCVRANGQPLAIPNGQAENDEYQMCIWYSDTIGIRAGDHFLALDPHSEKLRLTVVPEEEVKPVGTLSVKIPDRLHQPF